MELSRKGITKWK